VLAATGGMVALAGGNGGPHGNQVRVLDARTGQLAWIYGAGGVITVVSITDDAVYLNEDPVTALRASDGGQLWTSPRDPLYGPVTDGSLVYVAEGVLYALGARDGRVRWSFPADVTSNPVISAGVLYTLGARTLPGGGTENIMQAIRATDGTLLWSRKGPPGGAVATDGRTVCAVEGEEVGEPGRLWVYRAGDGQPLWHTPRGTQYGVPVISGGILFAVRGDGLLTAFRAADGTQFWTAGSTVAITPVQSRGVLYASDGYGRLVAREAATGKLAWTFPHRFTAGPVVAGDSVVVTNGHTVLAVPV
jgi:outer membrane protein assembly factor BamB